MKTAIENALVQAAQLGTFLEIVRTPSSRVVSEGLQAAPASIETNELSSVFGSESRYGRSFVQDRKQWQWEMVLLFDVEVITEVFEKALLSSPIEIARDEVNGIERQARLHLLDSRTTHPPRGGASNGTEVHFRFSAELCPL